MASSSSQVDLPAFMISKFPVLLPEHSALTASKDVFEKFVQDSLGPSASLVSDVSASEMAKVRQHMSELTHDHVDDLPTQQNTSETPEPSFFSSLTEYGQEKPRDLKNKMLTENGDLTNASSNDALVDLFFEMEDSVSGPRLGELLVAAWEENPLTTLKLIFNARSIHLGKGSRSTFYRAIGWLSNEHPVTFVTNLQWLVRPVVEKKVAKDKTEDDIVVIESEKPDDDPTRFDVRNGVAHGYWKDLLNILVLSAHRNLDVMHKPKTILDVHAPAKLYEREWDAVVSKQKRDILKETRHENIVRSLKEFLPYQCHHIAVARLFAEQLESDLKLLRSTDVKARENISLCAKWAPSPKGFHDKHTFVVSSIAEILHPQTKFPGVNDRELYLRHAREGYRKDISALRKALEVVERDVSSEQFINIKYDHVPSLAMHNYSNLFLKKDEDRFMRYIDQVVAGKKQISGATLLPSTLIKTAREQPSGGRQGAWKRSRSGKLKPRTAKVMTDQKLQETANKVIDSQWKTLVQRIRDSGSLESCIAVCDVSGSMHYPVLQDGSLPVDSAIGLSLLIAEVTKAPFGGSFITFSESPAIVTIDLNATLKDKVRQMMATDVGLNTNFVATFRDLILPMARKNKLTQAAMPKRMFVFSDMQFDEADRGGRWTTSFERIRAQYRLYGYEMPELVFWNLAGGRHGVAPKPVTNGEVGTALVSGYSQGMLKVFLENGSFEADEEDIVVDEEDGEEILVVEKKKPKLDSLAVVNKAVGHEAYKMLRIVD